MREVVESTALETSYQCAVCGTALPYHPVFFEDHCPKCGFLLWCYRRSQNGFVILEVIPGRTPELEDLDRMVCSLLQSSSIQRVVLDLSALDFVTTSLVARLVSLNKRIRAAGGRLVLCELTPIVCEAFRRFRLDTILEIAACEQEALERLYGSGSDQTSI
jgi:anti-anti-sigma factor